MSFKSFPRVPPSGENGTGSITELPANILEAFIPGYSIISRFLLEVLGFDITVVVSVCFLAFGLVTSLKYLYTHAYEQFKTYFMSFVSIESEDDIYEHVMDWLGEQQVSQQSQALMARTGHYSWDAAEADNVDGGDAGDGALLNFSNWDAKIPPKFQPYFGKHRFWHKGRFFELKRETKQLMMSSGWGSMLRDEETIRLSCIGRSTQPIKDLIKECQDRYFDKKSSRTTVRRPATKEMRSRGRNPWTKVATRPSRPMDTVVLENDQKEQVLADINEFLHPASPRWYANRGIPYRRGYLFYGPPGTGKTSLSFAIAGIFGLEIFCVSLTNDPSLTEEDLGLLFNNLPRRCVVLLEDIDSAGLVRRDSAPETIDVSKDKKDANTQIGVEIAKAFKSVQDKSDKNNKNNQGISLSGLLNAIDGVASHEGRVLVMTTNHPDKLDDALIRPGRVDMKVGFKLASRSQIRQLFKRMYSADPNDTGHDSKAQGPILRNTPQSPTSTRPIVTGTVGNGYAKVPNGTANLSPKSSAFDESTLARPLEDIANDFAECLPEGVLTPAEIQGFLLTQKKEPEKALKEVGVWLEKTLEAKAAKNKAISSE